MLSTLVFAQLLLLLGFTTCSITGLGGHRSSTTSSSYHSTHSSTATLPCIDKDIDCTQEICRKYPYTAKERCAKTCGLCHDTSSTAGFAHSSSHQTGTGPTEPCIDKDPDCSQDTCINYPYTAKHRCAKTCGLCQSGSSSTSSSSVGGQTSHSITHHTSSSRTSSISGVRDGSAFSSRRGSGESTISKLCIDKDLDCTQQICRDYPYTAKERCAKTCNLCDQTGRTSSHHSTTSTSTTTTGDIHSTDNILTKDREIECIDLDIDCTKQTCEKYPYTAKERCAKTCGFCHKGGKTSIESAYGKSSRQSSISDSSRRTSQGESNDRRGSTSSSTTTTIDRSGGACVDKDPKCDESVCMDRPYTARDKCAKTCGFCDSDGTSGSRGSLLSLRTDSIDNDKDDTGSLITLDNDDRDGSASHFASPTMPTSSRHSSHHGSSISSGSSHHRTAASSHSISDTIRSQQTTYAPPTHMTRTRIRTGPCVDQNRHCEKSDCLKYPRFSERYCEKTCGLC